MAHAVIGNFGLGVAMAATQIAGTALIQLIAPGRFRGRVMSVLNLNMGLAQVLTLPLALLGQWLSLQVLFPGLAGVLLVTTAVILASRRHIWSIRT